MRKRILITIVIITSLAVLGFAVPLGIAVADTYNNAARLGLQREATAATTQVPASFPTSGDPVELPAADDGTTLALYDKQGHLLTGSGPPTADPIVQRALDGHAADGRVGDDIVAAVPVASEENIIGAVRAAQPDGDVEARIWRARTLMALLALLVIGAAAGVATWQSRRLSRPLVRLAGNAKRLGGGDFTAHNEPSGFEEIDDAGDAMNRTATRLGVLIDRERAFSADVSHQLRTPLTALRLQLEAVKTTPTIDPLVAIDEALDSIDRLEGTIEDLIELARDTSAHQGPLDLAAVLTDLDETWRRPLAERSRRLNIRSPADLAPIGVSTAAVRQILAVLVANSSEHGDGTVNVDVKELSTGFSIEVSDEGSGINGDHDTPFTRRADRNDGRGIGLALARSLAEAEGGALAYLTTPHPRFLLVFSNDHRPDVADGGLDHT